jgi:hypothetical protein
MNMPVKDIKKLPKSKKQLKVSEITPEGEEIEEPAADVETKVDPEVEEIEKIIPSKKKQAVQTKHIDDPEEWARIEEERDTWD